MITADLLERSVERVSMLRYFPQGNKEARRVISALLIEICTDDDALKRAIGIIPRPFSEWTGPADLIQNLGRGLDATRFLNLPPARERCTGRDIVVTDAGDGRCSCPRGQRLRELDKLRETSARQCVGALRGVAI